MKKKLLATLGALVLLLAGIQLVPVDRTNPPVERDLQASAAVDAVLRRACYDCHSNETVWPWYSRVAPVSWLVAHDVHEGREALNYSTWGSLESESLSELMEETWEEVQEGEMPPRIYTLMHPEARLSGADRAVLQAWCLGERTSSR